MAMKLLPTRGYTILAKKTKNQRNSDCHRGWLIYCTSTSTCSCTSTGAPPSRDEGGSSTGAPPARGEM